MNRRCAHRNRRCGAATLNHRSLAWLVTRSRRPVTSRVVSAAEAFVCAGYQVSCSVWVAEVDHTPYGGPCLASSRAAPVLERKQSGPTSHFGRSGAAGLQHLFYSGGQHVSTYVRHCVHHRHRGSGYPGCPGASEQTCPAEQVGPGRHGHVEVQDFATSPARATPSAPVNLNAASIAQLQTLPGVGASTAQRILDYRQKNGGFKKIEDVMNVKGVGEKSSSS